ncbi:hypothetical protein [Lentilactobacillus kribbianus]|uniref:hypothetical protein n=1 Tax=Lentilactobacillus kribbianus TaxID=2729622 RepID=UPI001553B150|nr:hypothetical protein [Lentilactobacillus kribbianus]
MAKNNNNGSSRILYIVTYIAGFLGFSYLSAYFQPAGVKMIAGWGISHANAIFGYWILSCLVLVVALWVIIKLIDLFTNK